ncbi:hypothetical protein PMI10_03189, partial [Flavobacterium sp. CF136]
MHNFYHSAGFSIDPDLARFRKLGQNFSKRKNPSSVDEGFLKRKATTYS